MKTITVRANQTLFDIALEQYATCEAISEIMANNPKLTNNPYALAALGIETKEGELYADVELLPGSQLHIDTNSPHRRANILREITSEITTFDR